MTPELILEKLGQGRIVRTRAEADAIKPTSIFSLDIETGGKDHKVGDSPVSPDHSVAGVSVSDIQGNAFYIPITECRDVKDGMPLDEAIATLNRWTTQGSIMAVHNGKFDMAFLMPRGLILNPTLRVIDTWILRSMRCRGVFTSSKLKELAAARFGIKTETKSKIDEWLEANNTKDYGEIPTEILALYACDDVCLTLAILFSEPPLSPEEQTLHDLHWRNSLHLNAAQIRGLPLSVPKIKQAAEEKVKQLNAAFDALSVHTTVCELDPNNDQQMLAWLHRNNSHPGPRDYYGEKKFVVDYAACYESGHKAAKDYANYHETRRWLLALSPSYGEVGPHLTIKDGTCARLHCGTLISLFSKGGMPITKRPDFADNLSLDNSFASLAAPSPGFDFLWIKATDLPWQVLALYLKDTELIEQLEQGLSVADLLSQRTGLSPIVCAVLKDWMVEGSGKARAEQLLKRAGAKLKTRQHLDWIETFETIGLPNLPNCRSMMLKTLQAQGYVSDRLGRQLAIPQDRQWRLLPMLLQSSTGSILSFYLDAACRLAQRFNSHLVFAHEGMFLFETPTASEEFYNALRECCHASLGIEPRPRWMCRQKGYWEL